MSSRGFWKASEANETLLGLNNGNRRYIYCMSKLTFVAQVQNDVKLVEFSANHLLSIGSQ